MKIKVFLIVGLALCLTVHLALADEVDSVTIGAGWQTLTAPGGLATLGTPYFNNNSNDGTDLNAGYFITGTGGFTGNPTGTSPQLNPTQFWGMANGAADPSFHINKTCDFGQNISILLTLAGDAGTNVFGYRDSAGDHTLFTGGMVGDKASFSPSGDYVYWLIGKNASTTFGQWFTDSSLNSEGVGDQHFAAFRAVGDTSGAFYIAVEDLPFGATDKDYNDFVIKAECNPIPIPPSAILLGSGLLGLVGFRRFRS